MRAILLVAGIGRRLANPECPKSMLVFGGKTLISRHVAALGEAGCTALTVVVGHQQDQIRDELARLTPTFPITVRDNVDFLEGSVVSLHVAREDLRDAGVRGEATVVMDGDVLYPPKLLSMLRDGGGTSAFLVDTRSVENGEEMMVGCKRGRALKIARRVFEGDEAGRWDLTGESVGFMKIGAAHAASMVTMLERHVADGHRKTEYEAVYDKFMKVHEVGIVDVGDAPWTEIDFEEDVAKAREIVAGWG
ncbi:MAG: NTP transferase domain-containing protein [Polyangiales bacterium]